MGNMLNYNIFLCSKLFFNLWKNYKNCQNIHFVMDIPYLILILMMCKKKIFFLILCFNMKVQENHGKYIVKIIYENGSSIKNF